MSLKMVIINEIVSVIQAILSIRKQRSEDNDAYDILRTQLDINSDILQRMDPIFVNDTPTLKARTKLHQVVTQAEAEIKTYEDLSINVGIAAYSKKFSKLTQEFQICLNSLLIYVNFTAHEREQIHQRLMPPGPGGESGGRVGIAVATSSSPSISPMDYAVQTLCKYEAILEDIDNP